MNPHKFDFCLLCHCAAISILGCSPSSNEIGSGLASQPVHSLSLEVSSPLSPVSVQSAVPRLDLHFQLNEFKEAARPFWLSRGDNISIVLHALHAFHEWHDLRAGSDPTIEELRSVLLDQRVASRWYDGRLVAIETKSGLRYALPESVEPAGQAHVDQALAILAHIGVRLTRKS